MYLDIHKKAEIVVLYEQNISIREIARRLGISRSTVQLWVHRYVGSGRVDRRLPGPQPVTYTDNNALHRELVAKHAEPSATTRSTAFQHGVSMQTVRKHLRAAGVPYSSPSKKILPRELRVQFAKDYLNFDWYNSVVIFTCQKCFKSDTDGRITLWRKAGNYYIEKNVLPCWLSDRISLGYWGWMSSMGPGELVEVEPRNSSQDYLDILQNVMLPTVRIAYPEEHIYFVHDNYTTSLVLNWLNTQENLTVIYWPAKSSDFNPIENLWGHIMLNWDLSEVRSKSDLNEIVTSLWEAFRGTDLCWNMVTDMRSRLQQVIDSNGALIK